MSASLAVFTRLSAVLVGEEELPEDLANAYFERASIELQDRLAALLEKFEALVAGGKEAVVAVREDLLPDANVGAATKLILLLWYTGGFENAAGDWEMASADQYYRALVWEAIGAHAPALSNGYFGHWKYPPER